MKVTHFAVSRPVTTSMVFLALLLFGFMSYLKLPVNLMPEVNLPAMVIITDYPGATPGEVETEITNLLEKEVATINGLKLMQSYSMPNMSMIIVQFELDKDQDKAMAELRNKIDLVVSFLPKEAKLPFVRKRSKPLLAPFSMNSGSVVDLIITGNVDANKLYQLSRREIKDKLSRIDGVTKIEFNGGKLREIHVEVDKNGLYGLGMNITEVATQLKDNNVDMSGGDIVREDRESIIKTGNKYNSVESVKNTYIATPYGEKKLTDFATVKDTFQLSKNDAFFYDGIEKKELNNIVGISVQKSSTANAVSIAKEVKKLVPEIQKNLPEGVTLSLPFDSSEYIESSVNDAMMNVILGIIVTGLILFLFVNNIKATVIVSISIPVSLIINFLAMRLFDGSLNMLSLMSFAVAIGALVSNSIVVLENILRLKREGLPMKEACVTGTQEVFTAVLASTGTNLVVFLPIASMNSIVGAFFREYALTISFATIFSLLVSITLTPMLASILLKNDPKPSKFSNWIIKSFDKLQEIYERSLRRLMSRRRNPIILFAVMFFFFIMSMGLLGEIGFEFEPESDNGDLFVELEMQPGTSMEKNRELTKLVEQKIASYPEVNAILSMLGSKNSFTTGSNYTNISLKLNKRVERELSNAQIGEKLLNDLKEIPEIKPVVATINSEESGGDLGFSLKSNDAVQLSQANDQVMNLLKDVEGLISFESSLRNGPPLLQFKPKKRLLAELGISVNELALVIRSAITGIKATVMSENDVEYNINIKVPVFQTNTVEDIKQLPVHTETSMFTVGQLAEVSYENAPAQILHKEKSKTAEFSATLAPGHILGDVRTIIDAKFNEINLPAGVDFQWSGNVEELDNTVTDMTITFLLALVLMYMLLASLMESLWQPLVIFTTVPMALIGVFVIMYFAGTTMNIMSLMAIITLLGLVVNDDILIHDYTEQLMHKKKMDILSATILSGKTKMKAVIMTTVAIIFGMLPNAIGLGDAGAEYRIPMAIVTIGGMITSTVLTLYLIPSLFYVIRSRRQKRKSDETIKN
ncbi:efflux RND transporter permease subunit [Flagellimonas algicola]|uniref:Efflux RND transporter permease subunit n=1 Tax=Flagellimonas algicola TaxID=2583815 RepID=A0ABY2WKP2_9FLAO|nr:efflux RND transporter permease subunit [Allomuricauda algicola]TMU55141.1 efflux RND transporter permease subunit [Allomuricauda algicola]